MRHPKRYFTLRKKKDSKYRPRDELRPQTLHKRMKERPPNLAPDCEEPKVRKSKKPRKESRSVKTKFRESKEWRDFRDKMAADCGKIDYITQRPLIKGFNVHHLCLDPAQYEDLSKPENFIALNKQTHEVLHFCMRHWKRDPKFLDRIKELLILMDEINGELLPRDILSESDILGKEQDESSTDSDIIVKSEESLEDD